MPNRDKLRKLSIIDLVESLSIAMDLISPSIANHHRRVAFICWKLAGELGLPEHRSRDLIIAAMIHDCGALSLSHKLLTLHFEIAESEGFSISHHAETGYRLLKGFGPLARVAEIIRSHHQSWQGRSDVLGEVPEESYILHLADRVDILLRKANRVNVLTHREGMLEDIRQRSGTLFKPDLVEPLARLFEEDVFWLDIVNMSMNHSIGSYIGMGKEQMDCDHVLQMTEIFSHIIDFRSNHTAYHSSMVSTLSGVLARMAGMREEECLMMKIAGNLHDLGKLAIPLEIIEKPGKLSKEERLIINTHSYYTHRILSRFRDLEQIRCWAAYHHERLDGNGYPFRLGGKDLDLGSRIVAAADIYTALRETRSYREEMPEGEALGILRKMAGKALDGDIVDLVEANLPEVEHIRSVAIHHCRGEYLEVHPVVEK